MKTQVQFQMVALAVLAATAAAWPPSLAAQGGFGGDLYHNSSAGHLRVSTQSRGSILATIDDKPWIEYMWNASPLKPYVERLCTPAGVQILRDSPPDHKHHHGLMFAIGVDGVDFWGEQEGAGRQTPLSDSESGGGDEDGALVAHLVQKLDWTSPSSGKTLLTERRAIKVAALKNPRPVTFLTWNSRLRAAPSLASVKLDGHHYYGLGMRFVASMDKGGRFFSSAGQPGEVVNSDARLVAAKWTAYTAKIGGKRVTVAIFDHPKNPRHPNKFFTMDAPFAYLSATLKEPMTLEAGRELELRYAVAVWDGEILTEVVDGLYAQWAK